MEDFTSENMAKSYYDLLKKYEERSDYVSTKRYGSKTGHVADDWLPPLESVKITCDTRLKDHLDRLLVGDPIPIEDAYIAVPEAPSHSHDAVSSLYEPAPSAGKNLPPSSFFLSYLENLQRTASLLGFSVTLLAFDYRSAASVGYDWVLQISTIGTVFGNVQHRTISINYNHFSSDVATQDLMRSITNFLCRFYEDLFGSSD